MKQLRKKQKPQTTKQRTIDQLQFQIIPISINFIKQQQQQTTQQYYLYIEKGAQVLGKLDEVINTKRNTYVFQGTHNKQFRIANDKNLTYQWSIYRYTADNNQEQYLQSVSFNIKSKYIEFLSDLEKRQTDLYRIYLEKQKKTQIQQIWKDLRYDLTQNNIQMSCKFTKMGSNIVFKLVIKCDLDFRLQKWEQDREMRRLARTVNATTRKGSVDSKNKISQLSFYQSKEKISQVGNTNNNNNNNNNNRSNDSMVNNINDLQTLPIKLLVENQHQVQMFTEEQQNLEITSRARKQNNKSQNNQHQTLTLRESQIRVTDPEGMDVTDEIPSKFLNNKRIDIHDYYYRKKSSMLSDIIQESYQGSSNVITKSNQGEKLKSVDEIHQQDQTTPLFSPLIKTQNYDPQKDQQYFDRIKRTTTLVQKASQQFQIQQSPKMTPKRYSHYYPNVQPRNQLKPASNKLKQQPQLSVSDTKVSSSRKSSFTQQQQNQIVKDLYYQRKTMIKNASKVLIVLIILAIVIYFVGLFDHKEKKQNTNQKRKSFNKLHSSTKIDTAIKKDQSKKVKTQQQ